jgi:flagellar motility protein MotE (MotC chaperone)
MRRSGIGVVAVSAFVGFWLGFPSQTDPNGRSPALSNEDLIDQLSLSQSSAESPPADPKTQPGVESQGKGEGSPEKQVEVESKKEPVSNVEVEGCLPKSALEDIAKRKKELDDREARLTARDQELSAREKAAQDELKKIQAVRSEIEQVQGAKQKENEEKIARIVELLEGMTPKAASQLVATYDERLAVVAMSRMSTQKLSKILNLMEPKRSVRLMELLAGGGAPVSGVVNGGDQGAQNSNEVKK